MPKFVPSSAIRLTTHSASSTPSEVLVPMASAGLYLDERSL
jgi:hypothetical protein